MTVTTYQGWVNDGKPWKNCQPINDFIAMLRRHGYTGPGSGIGDQSHLTATPPEDHCPYSHTPWPGVQPYPYVMAIDIMPSSGVDIIWLGGQLYNDKSSNKAGTQAIKYINWTDSDGNCFHDSWMPNHARYASTDRGHIHISFRTDYVTSTNMAAYDPFGGISLSDAYQLLDTGVRTEDGLPFPSTYTDKNGVTQPISKIYNYIFWAEKNILDQIAQLRVHLDSRLDQIQADIANVPSGGGGGGTPGNFSINLSGVATPE